jgi:prepilin-type processing-associated H-X9-DG protein
MKTPSSKRSAKAFTLIELIVIMLTLGVLAVALVCWFARARYKALGICCDCNLKQVGLAFRTWAIDHSANWPTQVPVASGGTKELAGTGQVFVHFRVMSNELSTPVILVCPADRAKKAAHDFGPGFSDTNVSYFVSMDANEGTPQMLAVGDRNLAFQGQPIKPSLFTVTTNKPSLSWTRAIHDSRGNICLADGSVQSFGTKLLAEAAENQGVATNHLAIP